MRRQFTQVFPDHVSDLRTLVESFAVVDQDQLINRVAARGVIRRLTRLHSLHDHLYSLIMIYCQITLVLVLLENSS